MRSLFYPLLRVKEVSLTNRGSVQKNGKIEEVSLPCSLDKVQSELASVFDKNGKGVAIATHPPLVLFGSLPSTVALSLLWN